MASEALELVGDGPTAVGPASRFLGAYDPVDPANSVSLQGSTVRSAGVRDGRAPEPVASGDLLDGAYELKELLGEGAMGSVWRARNVNLDKEVAIKLVRLANTDPEARSRLRNEARLAAKINHPNVVGVFDTGVTEDGAYYLVMELLDGRDLSELLAERKALPATEAVQLLLPVLAGLECAHKRKIFHRDIKPENIFLARCEDRIVPKLVDFGIALAGDAPREMRTTRSGTLLGTPLYMAPEQTRGSLELDERTDVWAVATVLYELIAGRAPFASDSLPALFVGIAFEPVHPLDEAVCDPALAEIVHRGLAKNPAERWPSAREMGMALAAWLIGRGVHEDVSGESVEKIWFRRGSDPSLAPSLPASAPPSAPRSTPHVAWAAIASAPPRLRRSLVSRVPFPAALAAAGVLALGTLALVQAEPTSESPTPPVAASAASPDRAASLRDAHAEANADAERAARSATRAREAHASPTRPSPKTSRTESAAPARSASARAPAAARAVTETSTPAASSSASRSARPSRIDPNWGF